MARYVYGASRSYQARMYRIARRRQGGRRSHGYSMKKADYVRMAWLCPLLLAPFTCGLSLLALPVTLLWVALAYAPRRPRYQPAPQPKPAIPIQSDLDAEILRSIRML
jgi:hypothetical protein